MTMTLLKVEGLSTSFFTRHGELKAIEDVSFTVESGEVLAIVGESGCGKSLTALSMLRLVPNPPGRIVGGRVLLDGTDLLQISEEVMRGIRGDRVSMIFQEPMTSLNPVLRIGTQIVEAQLLHRNITKAEARKRAIELLDLVGMPDPEKRVDDYPHRLSGGQRQRVMIAMALALEPRLLIADEPTTALDVTIEAQILELLVSIQAKMGMGMVLITHDLGVMAEIADRVLVMYAGRVVEEASVYELFDHPKHPYTRGLIEANPGMAPAKTRLREIPGIVPPLGARETGCSFSDRCELADARCAAHRPELRMVAENHKAACFYADAVKTASETLT